MRQNNDLRSFKGANYADKKDIDVARTTHALFIEAGIVLSDS